MKLLRRAARDLRGFWSANLGGLSQRMFWLLLGLWLGVCACSSPSATTPTPENPPPPGVVNAPAPATPSPPSPTPTPTATPPPSPTPFYPPAGSLGEHFIFTRPIDVGVDITYRYGSTQNGTRTTHHGSDLLAECGVPVRAAGDGEVVAAGGDWLEVYGPYESFYGNLVVLRHDAVSGAERLFTLYGHLSTVAAEVGERVARGDVLGEVGFTGAAVGCHLHFEVRVGENDYTKTRNPELWMIPYRDEEGTFYGAISGRLMGMTGYPIPNVDIEIQRLDDAGEVVRSWYTITYADISVHGDDAWGENFAIGDVEPGPYRIQFVAGGLHVYEVEVLPGQLALIEFEYGE